MRLTVDNTLRKIKPSTNRGENFPNLKSNLKRLMFNTDKPYAVTPHRLIIDGGDGTIIKQPLDAMGIELNRKENEILVQRNLWSEIKDDGTLIHLSSCTRSSLTAPATNLGFGYNNTIPLITRNQNIKNNDLNYNFLTGEKENPIYEDIESITTYSFYDIG